MNPVVELMNAILRCDRIDPFTRIRAEMLRDRAIRRDGGSLGSIFARN